MSREEDLMMDVYVNKKSIRNKVLGSLLALVLTVYFLGWKPGFLALYLLLGWKVGDLQGYGFSDWQIYATSVFWLPLVVLDAMLGWFRDG